MNLLVTGGAGFIGSRYVRSLLADDAAFLDRLVTTINLAALGRLAPLLAAGDGEAAAELLRRALVRETISA